MDEIAQHKKIVILISPPRSLSTAVVSMITAQKNFIVINEPSSAVFNTLHYPETDIFYNQHALKNYTEVKNKIFSVNNKNIFIKEMSYAFDELIHKEPQLLQHPHVYFVILLRRPHEALISYYKKLPSESIDFIMPHLFTLSGYYALHQIVNILKKHAINFLHIIKAEDLYIYPDKAIPALYEFINIPFDKNYLNWKSHANFNAVKSWQEAKKDELIYHWHHEAIASTHFHQPPQYQLDENDEPTFGEIKNIQHKKLCMEIYKKNKLYYLEILKTLAAQSG